MAGKKAEMGAFTGIKTEGAAESAHRHTAKLEEISNQTKSKQDMHPKKNKKRLVVYVSPDNAEAVRKRAFDLRSTYSDVVDDLLTQHLR